MPKATFYNLPEEKQSALMKACQKEFSRVPVFQASIANIVKTANISRGSFYQYFEDKEDAYFYLLRERIRKKNSQFLVYLEQKEGNLFEAFTLFYHNILQDIPNNEDYLFFRNALLNVTHHIETIFNETIETHLKNSGMEQFKKLVDTNILNIEIEKELPHVIQIVTAVAFRNFVERYRDDLTNDAAMEKFQIEMDLLKRGLAK